MIWTIAAILFVLWLFGFAAFHVAGGLIHHLLVVAAVVIHYPLITGRRAQMHFRARGPVNLTRRDTQ